MMDIETMIIVINFLYNTNQISNKDYKKWMLSEDKYSLPKLIKK